MAGCCDEQRFATAWIIACSHSLHYVSYGSCCHTLDSACDICVRNPETLQYTTWGGFEALYSNLRVTVVDPHIHRNPVISWCRHIFKLVVRTARDNKNSLRPIQKRPRSLWDAHQVLHGCKLPKNVNDLLRYGNSRIYWPALRWGISCPKQLQISRARNSRSCRTGTATSFIGRWTFEAQNNLH